MYRYILIIILLDHIEINIKFCLLVIPAKIITQNILNLSNFWNLWLGAEKACLISNLCF